MNFFDQLQKKGSGALQAQKANIRKIESKNPLKPLNPLNRSSSAPLRAPNNGAPAVNVARTTFNGNNANRAPIVSHAHPEPSLRSTPPTSRTRMTSSSGVRVKARSHSSLSSSPASSTPPYSPGNSAKSRVSQRSRSTQLRKRASPLQKFSSSSDESDDDDIDALLDLRVVKRVKQSASAEPDLERRIICEDAFSKLGSGLELQSTGSVMVHAADITVAQTEKPEYKEAFTGKPITADSPCASILLQYPTYLPPEKYGLAIPRDQDGFGPLDDILQVVEVVSQNYIPESELHLFNDESTGINRRLRRSIVRRSQEDFMSAIQSYNDVVERLRNDGAISKHVQSLQALPLPLLERILSQVYARAVSPRVDSLRQYENGSDNVYGELLTRFVSEIIRKTRLKSNHVFVDLGSGVGNVVLQTALEAGCESWGCEIMQNPCSLARLQQAEFDVRCRLWGLTPGSVRLVEGDFLEEASIVSALRRADVVLINNRAFTPETNAKLINHILDMKEGCLIVSLASFVPSGHKIQTRNLNSPINLLTVEEHSYWPGWVSWSSAGGVYYIAKKDSSRLRAFANGLR